ncbi:MAG: hypothetical protein J6W30_09510 [Bacteroidales bacterium]|nr:hypothetical protein [Bacteroidales bacterium]
MKKQFLHLVLLLLLIGLSACSDDGIDINVNDPQHIPWVEDLIDPDLLNAIGVENIYFGHTPPNIDSLSFIVEKLEYDTCIRYRKITIMGVDTIMPSYNNPGLENSVYKHHFFNCNENIAGYKMHIKAHTGDESFITTDSIFVIGYGNNFTAYYQKKLFSEKEGNPTWAYLITGTVEYDSTNKILGVSNYHIGKKILAIDFPPTQGYYPGTLMYMKPYSTNPDIIPCRVWDTLPDRSNNTPFSF